PRQCRCPDGLWSCQIMEPTECPSHPSLPTVRSAASLLGRSTVTAPTGTTSPTPSRHAWAPAPVTVTSPPRNRPRSPTTAPLRLGRPRPPTTTATWSPTRARSTAPNGGPRARSPEPPANGVPGSSSAPAEPKSREEGSASLPRHTRLSGGPSTTPPVTGRRPLPHLSYVHHREGGIELGDVVRVGREHRRIQVTRENGHMAVDDISRTAPGQERSRSNPPYCPHVQRVRLECLALRSRARIC